jgi:serine/threonine protein kinase
MATAGKTKKVFDGKFEILSIVGRGAKSVVYHARHVNPPHQEVALKVLLNNEEDQTPQAEKLRKEALAMVSSNHRYVIRLNDFHSVDNLSYISMELAPQGDLRKYADRSGGLVPLEQIETFLLQAAEALHNVHKNGIIHRDIKPENILVVSDKEIRLADFGLALLPGEVADKKEIEGGVGTFDYMAPEILEGQPFTQATDIYGLGVTFYEMLSGRNPFAGRSLAQQMELRRDEKIPSLRTLNPDAPEYLTSAITQAISFEPGKRFSTAKELLQTVLVNKQRMRSTPKSVAVAPISEPLPLEQNEMKVETKSLVEEIKEVPVAPILQAEAAPELSGTVALNNSAREQIVAQAVSGLDPAANADEIGVGATVAFSPKQLSELIGRNESGLITRPSTLPDRDGRAAEASRSTVFLGKGSLKEALSSFGIFRKVDIESRRSLVMVLSITVVILGLLLSQGALNKFVRQREESPVASHMTATAQAPVVIPDNQAQNGGAFPFLPGGIYSGTISGIRTGANSPLIVVSLPSENRLMFLAGASGWTPAKVDLTSFENTKDSNPTLRVASGGGIFLITGQNVDGTYIGFVTDAVSGRKGEWQVTRLAEKK